MSKPGGSGSEPTSPAACSLSAEVSRLARSDRAQFGRPDRTGGGAGAPRVADRAVGAVSSADLTIRRWRPAATASSARRSGRRLRADRRVRWAALPRRPGGVRGASGGCTSRSATSGGSRTRISVCRAPWCTRSASAHLAGDMPRTWGHASGWLSGSASGHPRAGTCRARHVCPLSAPAHRLQRLCATLPSML